MYWDFFFGVTKLAVGNLDCMARIRQIASTQLRYQPGNDDHDRSRSMIAIIMMIDDRFRSFSCDHQSSNDRRNLVNL